MEFSYSSYLRSGLIVPVGAVFFGVAVLFTAIVNNVRNKGNVTPRNTILLFAAIALLILDIIVNFGTLKHSIYLISEKETDATVSEGKIDKISEVVGSPRYYVSDESKEIVRASIVRINGADYYFMTAEGLEIGDFVDFCYLPRSKVVLSWKKAVADA